MSCLDPVKRDDLFNIWNQVVPYLEKALQFSDEKFKIDDILRGCMKQDMMLWVVYNDDKLSGCFVTELFDYPQDRRLNILLLSGDGFDDIVEHLEKFKEWASANGANAIEMYGRPGWKKVLEPHGFERTHTVMRLNI